MGYDSPVPAPLRPVGGWKKNVTWYTYLARVLVAGPRRCSTCGVVAVGSQCCIVYASVARGYHTCILYFFYFLVFALNQLSSSVAETGTLRRNTKDLRV